MGEWLLILGMFLILHNSHTASGDNFESSRLYMEACAKQELFANVPPLNFTCENKVAGGYYADMDTGCHIFHLCAPSNLHSLTDHPFCCHPELVFDQRFLVCDRPENVDCPVSHRYYSDQFDGPVKVLERENEENLARSRARQSRGGGAPTPEEVEEAHHGAEEAHHGAEEEGVVESDAPPPSGEGAGKAVTLPPAFRQR